MLRMTERNVLLILLTALLFMACRPLIAQTRDTAFSRLNTFFSHSDNLWDDLRDDFRLPSQAKHPKVQAQIAWLLRSPERFEKMIAQAEPYLYYIHHELKRRHLPAELALMPMIESAYDPFAYSAAGAAGLWQIMPGTGSGFGLKLDWWYDGRRDVYDSTQVALDYLVYLYNFLDHNWFLAVAAYDSGEGTVHHAVMRNKRQHKPTDIWSLRLPRETTSYVPRLFAAVEIIKHPDRYHVTLPVIDNKPYFERVKLGFQVKFRDIAKLTHLDLTEIYKLNPGYNRWATDPDGPYHIVLPVDKIALFTSHLKDLTHHEYTSLKRYKVKRGDSLSVIAKRFETTVALLKAVNKLTSNHIQQNQMLNIPEGGFDGTEDISRNVITKKIRQLGPRKIVHIVKARDTLVKIASRYRTKVTSLQFWNQLEPMQHLKPGMKLVIWKKNRRRLRHRVVHYRIRHGDALLKIARRYHVSVKQLKHWNPSLRGKTIREGRYIEIVI